MDWLLLGFLSTASETRNIHSLRKKNKMICMPVLRETISHPQLRCSTDCHSKPVIINTFKVVEVHASSAADTESITPPGQSRNLFPFFILKSDGII